MVTNSYTGLWTKYKPAILRLMIDADREPQGYQLSEHEFRAFNHMKRGVYAFTLTIANGRVVSKLKDSVVAQDLWETLQLSPKAIELASTGTFHFSMDRTFKLLVQKENN